MNEDKKRRWYSCVVHTDPVNKQDILQFALVSITGTTHDFIPFCIDLTHYPDERFYPSDQSKWKHRKYLDKFEFLNYPQGERQLWTNLTDFKTCQQIIKLAKKYRKYPVQTERLKYYIFQNEAEKLKECPYKQLYLTENLDHDFYRWFKINGILRICREPNPEQTNLVNIPTHHFKDKIGIDIAEWRERGLLNKVENYALNNLDMHPL